VATFVIVHGGWGGAWEWRDVAAQLQRRGHDVFTPTLTGMGERAHLRYEPGKAIHARDVIALLELEDIRRGVLCGHSYGGFPATAAADAVPDRVRLLVYIDALVPMDGQSVLDLLPQGFGDDVRDGLDRHGPDWRMPIPAELLPPEGLVAPEARRRYVERLRDHPAASFAEPVRLTGAVERVSRAFLRCTSSDLEEATGADPIEPCAARARAEGWLYRELPTAHDPQLLDPAGTAAALDELTRAS